MYVNIQLFALWETEAQVLLRLLEVRLLPVTLAVHKDDTPEGAPYREWFSLLRVFIGIMP